MVNNPEVFKLELDPSDHIKLAKIPRYEEYDKGIKIDIQPGMKPVANYSMRSLPLHYAELAQKLYQDLIDQKVARAVLPNEKCEWVSPSRVIVKPSPPTAPFGIRSEEFE